MGIQINGQTDTVASTTSGGSVTLTSATLPSVSNISATRINVSGVSTFTSGPVLIGSGTSTGNASQPLQVSGGAYVSGSLGIGTINPSEGLHIVRASNGGQFAVDNTGQQYTSVNFKNSGTRKGVLEWENTGNELVLAVDASGSPTGALSLWTGNTRRLFVNSSGNIGVGNTNPQVKLDVSGTISATQFNLPNNYALVAYSEGNSTTSRSTTSTSFIDDEDNGTVRASFTYKRGDIIVFEAFIPGGVALSDTDVANYAGVLLGLRASNGTTTTDSSDTRVWYRDDNRGIRETMQLCTCTLIINAASTTFNENDTVYAYIRYARIAGAGSISVTGMCQWGGRRFVRGYQFRKVA